MLPSELQPEKIARKSGHPGLNGLCAVLRFPFLQCFVVPALGFYPLAGVGDFCGF